ncbi:MAG TPA: bifunctional diaminohydroxyphosphoribosylaminopyrimidine deaminase/5-amino-6-(5-phosphoribosylamino)uracil reductase RibD [Caulobacteraceae bacterium]|jgi:diaminohydroxyphosphoribosylaminopyrimidine deaminase/5-amino-6-(5-phosphoribosylamino)uracil reductase
MGSAWEERFMRRGLELARARLGQTGDNPAVGCVVVRGDEVLAEAVTAISGRPHGEEQALDTVGHSARGATAYLTLEPCGERSSGAPSCAELLVQAGVTRVVIAAEDPSPKASGQGIERLRRAGVEVVTGVLAEEAEPLYAAYRARLAAKP